ncbi:MAG: MFS transporter [Chloroflexi bacterium]|jgi:MFS family permease|nr:MFS transporter [Chloroflexota bacterium]MBT3670160.1 MFS transporter [Chloroflexota bacterium]MBT4004029.1 MFS transporter [Chloroflexota bacterium]MBT4306166.1 MFS transporter [Chloroflexota bacterium]MBT4534546.1 MFS transporter [Chloroflexota bacterium]
MKIDLKQPSMRITATLFAGQSFTSAAIIAIGTVLTIVATQLSGDPAKAGLPTAFASLAAAPASFVWGILWDRIGRRKGLAIGVLFGAVGMVVAIIAFQIQSFVLFVFAYIGIGFSRSAMLLGRFIAAEVNPPNKRGQAISYVVFGGTVGAVLGPLLVSPSAKIAIKLGMDELAGPFLIAIFIFLIAAIIIYFGLNPEPKTIGEQIDLEYPEEEIASGKVRTFPELLKNPGVIVAVTSMIIGQAVMTLVMGMTALFMRDNGHNLADISIVFSAHTLGMFAFSVLTGNLADRWGRPQVIITGSMILLASFVLAPLSLTTSMIALALFLLGLGWNFCFVAGSALLADILNHAERSKSQGANDLLIALSAAGASFGGGVVYANYGFPSLNGIGAFLTLIPLILTLWWSLVYQKRIKNRI